MPYYNYTDEFNSIISYLDDIYTYLFDLKILFGVLLVLISIFIIYYLLRNCFHR